MREGVAGAGRIPVAGPWITRREIEAVADAVTNGWYANAGVYDRRFEAAFCEYVGRAHACALPSCTSALHLALLGLGIGPGDEVVVPELTWIASSAPVSYVGATPVFADVDPESWCLSPEALAAAATPRTKAVIVVDLYGNMPDMEGLVALAERLGIAVIEDAAEAIGAECRGRRAGGFGAASAFSFHGSKTLTTGEGGMLLTDDEELYRRALFFRDHGRDPGDRSFFNRAVGYKYRMSAMQAALGLAQLERVEELVRRKREIFGWYRDALADVREVTLNREAPGTRSAYWMVTALLDPALGLRKEELGARLSESGIDTRPFFHPLSSIPAYRELPQARAARERNRNSYSIAPWGINLPSGFNLNPETVEYVCTRLKAVLDEWKRACRASAS